MQPTVIIRLPEVRRRTGLSRSQIYALIAQRKFPSQIELGIHAVGWLEGDVDAWIAAKVNATRAGRQGTTMMAGRA